MTDLVFAPAHELAETIRERKVSATEVLEAYLDQIARHNPSLNAIVTLDEPGARRRAHEADAALDRGEVCGPLHGVPVTLKDIWDVAGLRSTLGKAGTFANRVAPVDSPAAARLKAAGAIVLGKTNCELFPDNPFGATRNPWNIEHTPGVSSSGSAAALAAGLTALDIGSDVGGSITVPSHYCGVFGMRPTEARVPLGAMALYPAPLWRGMMWVAGPLARSVKDLRLALRITSHADGRDTDYPPAPWQDVPRPALRDLRIAWAHTFPGLPVAADIRSAIERLAGQLDQLGAQVEQTLPALDIAAQLQLGGQLIGIIANAFATPPSSLGDYLMALQRRDSFVAGWEDFFNNWDVFICPPQIVSAPRQDEVGKPIVVDGQTVNLSEGAHLPLLSPSIGYPAVVIPLAIDRSGLPIGVQIMSRRWTDERLLAIAELLSEVTGGYQRPPGY